MSGDSTDYRRELPAHQNPESDLFVMRFSNPHTAIPDWLVTTSRIRLELRHMAAVIIILQKRPMPPTKDEIAEVLGVEPRTVQRWLAELRNAGVLSYRPAGKRRIYVFHEPSGITDPAINDPTVGDRMESSGSRIIDRWRSHDARKAHATHAQPAAMNDDSRHNTITDPPSGSSGHDSIGESELPTTAPPFPGKVTPDLIVTTTGRWLTKIGFNITHAYRFQTIPLEVAQRDYARRRDLGQGNGAIINAWLVDLPEFDLLSKESGAVVNESRRAELRAKYGDLFMFAGDEQPTEGVD